METAVRGGGPEGEEVSEMGGSFTRRFVAITAAVTAAFGFSAHRLGASAAPHAASAIDGTTALPGEFGAIVVDAATSHVFVSLHDTNKVAVLDLSGHLLTTIDNESGAASMALANGHLYVVRSTEGSIDEIDTTTLQKIRTVTTGLVGPADLVSAAGALWVAEPAVDLGKLVRVAIADGTQTPYDNPATEGDGLRADPADTNTIFAWTKGWSPLTVVRIDLAHPDQAAATFDGHTHEIDNVSDIAVSPDGAHLVPAGGYPYEFDDIATSTMQPSGLVYPATNYPSAVAMTSAHGGLFAGAVNGSPGVWVYPLGHASPLLANANIDSPAALAWAPDGLSLYAVSSPFGANAVFHVFTFTDLDVSATSFTFGNQRIGTYGAYQSLTITNSTANDVTLDILQFVGANPFDFFGSTNCFAGGTPATLAPSASCIVHLYFAPLKLGTRRAALRISFEGNGSPMDVALTGSGTEGYVLAGLLGEIGTFGDAGYYGDATTKHLAAFMRAVVTTPNGAGYWLLGGDGGIFTYGNAHFYGSTGGRVLNAPISGMAATPDGAGYWTVATDGGIFRFGGAHFYGSMGGHHLNAPIVGMARTPDGHGYWLVASDGGIFRFGNAGFYGSLGGQRLSAAVNQMVASPSGHGYWLLTGDGHVYGFGDAHSYGQAVGQTIVGMAPTPDGKGYWLVSRTGGVFRYGDAKFYGSLGGLGITDVMGIAASAPPLPPQLLPYTAPRNASERGWSVVAGGAGMVPSIRETTGRRDGAASAAPWRSRGSSAR